MQQAIFYACLVEDDEAGVFVDYLYFGGIAATEVEAENIMRSLTNDRSLPGAIIPKKYALDIPFKDIINKARKHYNQLAKDVYDMEEMQVRSKMRR